MIVASVFSLLLHCCVYPIEFHSASASLLRVSPAIVVYVTLLPLSAFRVLLGKGAVPSASSLIPCLYFFATGPLFFHPSFCFHMLAVLRLRDCVLVCIFSWARLRSSGSHPRLISCFHAKRCSFGYLSASTFVEAAPFFASMNSASILLLACYCAFALSSSALIFCYHSLDCALHLTHGRSFCFVFSAAFLLLRCWPLSRQPLASMRLHPQPRFTFLLHSALRMLSQRNLLVLLHLCSCVYAHKQIALLVATPCYYVFGLTVAASCLALAICLARSMQLVFFCHYVIISALIVPVLAFPLYYFLLAHPQVTLLEFRLVCTPSFKRGIRFALFL